MNKATKTSTKATTILLSSLISSFCCSHAYANSQFADRPLYLQDKSLKKTGYSAKPNVLFLVNTSNITRVSNVNDVNYQSEKVRKVRELTKALELTFDKNSNRKNFNFAVYPFDTYTCDEYDFQRNPACDVYRNFHNPERKEDFDALMNILYSNTSKDIPIFKTENLPTFRTFHKVLRNSVMNRLEYRCQKPYLIFVEFGDYQGEELFSTSTLPVTDSTLSGLNKDYGYDGYFDGDSVRNNDMFGYTTNSKWNALQYYTDTLRNKNFGNYIYTKDIVRTGAYSERTKNDEGEYTEYLASTKHSDRKLVDNAGRPWNETDPHSNLPGHSKNFTQTAETFVVNIGQLSFSKYNPSKNLPYGVPSWKAFFDRKEALLINAASPITNSNSSKTNSGRYYYSILENDYEFKDSAKVIENTFQDLLDEISKISGGKYVEEDNNVKNNSFSPIMGSINLATSNKSLIVRVQTDTDEWGSKLCIYENNETNKEKDFLDCKVQPNNKSDRLIVNDGKNSYAWNSHEILKTNEDFMIPNMPSAWSKREVSNSLEWKEGLLAWLNRSLEDNQIRRLNDGIRRYDEEKFWHQPYRLRKSDTNTIGDIINNTIESTSDGLYLVTSANDGMVHVYQANSNNNSNYSYNTIFKYMPMAIERDSTDGSDLVSHYYKELTNISYAKTPDSPHLYLLDGGITLVTTPRIATNDNTLADSKPRQTFMVSNMGQAGRGAFAINIGGKDLTTGRSIFDAPYYNYVASNVSLFQTPIGKDNKFGYTIGTPMVGITRVNRENNAPTNTYTDHLRETAFINNGVNFPGIDKNENESALYIYDVLGIDVGTETFKKTGDAKGTLIKKLTATDGKGGLAGPVVYDINNDGIADLIYAGDYGGNLYRFDIRNPHPDKWTVTKIFKADGPITSAPTLFNPIRDDKNPNNDRIIVVFGTGSELYQSDLDNKDQQAIYGIYDEFDKTGSDALVQKNDLLVQTMTYKDNNGELSSHEISLDKHKGWYFNLNNDGERVTTNINSLLSTGMVVTRSYNHMIDQPTAGSLDPCLTDSSTESIKTLSRITQFDARNGGKLSKTSPRFKLSNVNGATIGSSYGFNGALGMIISITTSPAYQYNNLNAGKSGDQKIDPNATGTSENCIRASGVQMHLSDGQPVKLENVPFCGIEIKSLGWREIKDTYLQS